MRLLASFNFNSENALVIIVSIIAFFILIAICIIYGLSNHSLTKHHKEIKELSNSLRIFVVDVKNDKVSYFNSAHLKERKSSSITTFYNQYRSKEREQLINWIGDLLDQDLQTPKFLEINVYIKAMKKSVSSILEVEKIDYRKQLIYLESRILQTSYNEHKKLSFSSIDILHKKILMSNGKGATYYVNFYNKMTKTSDISQLIYVDIRDILISFANENVIVVEDSFGQIIVTNFDVKNKSEIISFASALKTKINRFLLIKSYLNEVNYSVGIIENSESFRDVDKLIRNVKAISELPKDGGDQIALYSDSKLLLTDEQSTQFRTDVQNIISNNNLKYLFQPIYNVDRNKIVAYQASTIPIDSFFKDIDSLKNYALRTEDDKELFSSIAKNTISRFVQEKNEDNLELFFPISLNEVNYVNKSLGHISGVNDVNIVLVLKEKDLSAVPADFLEEGLKNSLRSFKSKGYSVALEIDDDILTLSPTLYSVFDYFNLSVASHISKKNAGRNLPSFQGLIEKLLHYNKPIVALDIASWDIVELVYRLGVPLICSDAIALPAENIMPLPKKLLMKIQNLKS